METRMIGDGSLRKSNYDPNLADELRRDMAEKERLAKLKGKGERVQDDVVEDKGQVNVESGGDFWRIENVLYRGQVQPVRLLKGLLDNGAVKTQDGWAEYSNESRSKGEFYTPNYQLAHSTIRALWEGRDGVGKSEVEEIREFLKKTSREKWLMMLTRVGYKKKGKDEVIHDYGLANAFSERVDFAGKDERVISSCNKDVYRVLLGDEDVGRIAEIYQWLNETPVHLWRVNSKPEQDIERVARLNAGSGWAYFYCDRVPSGANASLGVVAEGDAQNF